MRPLVYGLAFLTALSALVVAAVVDTSQALPLAGLAAVLLASDVYVRYVRPLTSFAQQGIAWALGSVALGAIATLGAVGAIELETFQVVAFSISSGACLVVVYGARQLTKQGRSERK